MSYKSSRQICVSRKQQSESDASNALWNTLFRDICALMFTFLELLSLTVVWRLRHADPSNDASITRIKPEWRYRKGCSRFTVLYKCMSCADNVATCLLVLYNSTAFVLVCSRLCLCVTHVTREKVCGQVLLDDPF